MPSNHLRPALEPEGSDRSSENRDWRRSLTRVTRVIGWPVTLALVLLLVVNVSQPAPRVSAEDCAQLNAQAYQPRIGDANDGFQRAGTNSLGSNYQPIPKIKSGVNNVTSVDPFIPCVVLKAIGVVESSWRQAVPSVPRGETGQALTGYGVGNCGYGMMQITTGMNKPGAIDPTVQRRIAEEYQYNIGYGAKMLADKWNYIKATMGDRNPTVAENWYFAVWAYNYWGFKNNPNNPDYPWPRQPYNPNDSKLKRNDYPYQELVWGIAAHPPTTDNNGEPWWSPVALSLPDRSAIPPNVTDATVTTNVPNPASIHTDTCNPVAAGQITINPTSLSFLMKPGSSVSSAQSIFLSSTNGQVFNWQVSNQPGWLDVPKAAGSGSANAQILLSANSNGFSYGWVSGTVKVAASGNFLQPLSSQVQVRRYINPLSQYYFPFVSR